MEWYEIGLIIVVAWAVIHTYMDMMIKKKVEKLEKEFNDHKH